MKASILIALLTDLVAESDVPAHELEVFMSKGDYSQEVIAADPYVFCKARRGWVKCQVPTCKSERKEGILLV